MCEFPSWTEKDGEVYFLTDKDVAERESDLSRQKEPADYVGHSAIEIVFKVQGEDKEGFPCHPVVARAIRDGKMNRLMGLGGYKKISINKNGRLHYTDGPAIEHSDGTKKWYLNGQLHRTDGPAIEWSDGTKFWYLKNQLSRMDGPAIEYSDGTKEWYLNGQLHRMDGPAIEWNDGTKKWYLKGELQYKYSG